MLPILFDLLSYTIILYHDRKFWGIKCCGMELFVNFATTHLDHEE